MVSSEIELCNGAFSLLGETQITSFTDGKWGPLVKSFYPNTRDAVLRLHPWNFAVKRVALAPETASPVFEYSYLFKLPADLLRVLEVYDNTDYRIEGRNILTDTNIVYLRYIYKNSDVVQYDSLFVEALQAMLAFKLAYPITKSKSMTEIMGALFKDFLKIAKSTDALEEPAQTFGDFPLINVR